MDVFRLLIQSSGIPDFLKKTYLFDCKQYTKHLLMIKVINPLIFLIFAFLPVSTHFQK